MYECLHRVVINEKIYEYPSIKSAIRGLDGYKSILRTYGGKRTKEEAIELVKQWEKENPHQYKKRDS